MPEPSKLPTPKKLPKWAWIAAIGGALVIGFFLLRKTSTSDTAAQAAPQGASSGGGGDGGSSGVGAGSTADASPLSPIATPSASLIDVGNVAAQLSTLQEPISITPTSPNVSPSALISSSMLSPSGIDATRDNAPNAPYISGPTGTLVIPEVTMPTLTPRPGYVTDTYGEPTIQSQQLINTPNVHGTPGAYGGVLAPEG